MNIKKFKELKLQNFRKSMALLAGMFLLLFALLSFFLDTHGMILAGIILAGLLGLLTQIPSEIVMRMQGGRILQARQIPNISRIMGILSRRAGLDKAPRIYYVPVKALNAFATGSKKDPAIAVTYGLLKQLSLRELTGVLAHELSHISNNDLKLNALMNLMGRMTRLFSLIGQILILINLTLDFMGEPLLPWMAILLLIAGPYLSTMMILAFSRTREFEADLEAARLTGDPLGLASALQKLNYINELHSSFLYPIRKIVVPKALRSHPTTVERVNRLKSLAPRYEPVITYPEDQPIDLDAMIAYRKF